MPKHSKSEFLSIIQDLLEIDEVKQLKNLAHHNTNRLDHSLNVAYLGYVLARKFGYDYVSTARAGLLHDLFFYETSDCEFTMKEHLRCHPEIALDNARKITQLNQIEENIILSHMYLVSNAYKPTYPESKIICFIDKYSSLQERVFKKMTLSIA